MQDGWFENLSDGITRYRCGRCGWLCDYNGNLTEAVVNVLVEHDAGHRIEEALEMVGLSQPSLSCNSQQDLERLGDMLEPATPLDERVVLAAAEVLLKEALAETRAFVRGETYYRPGTPNPPPSKRPRPWDIFYGGVW